jgi:hypothetical protein
MITAGEMLSKLDTARGAIAEADEDNESLESADGGGVKHAIDGQQAPVMACSRAASAPPRKMRLGSRRSSTAWSRRRSTGCRTRPGSTPGRSGDLPGRAGHDRRGHGFRHGETLVAVGHDGSGVPDIYRPEHEALVTVVAAGMTEGPAITIA